MPCKARSNFLHTCSLLSAETANAADLAHALFPLGIRASSGTSDAISASTQGQKFDSPRFVLVLAMFNPAHLPASTPSAFFEGCFFEFQHSKLPSMLRTPGPK